MSDIQCILSVRFFSGTKNPIFFLNIAKYNIVLPCKNKLKNITNLGDGRQIHFDVLEEIYVGKRR